MNKKEKSVEILQWIVGALPEGAKAHYIQSTVFAKMGYKKLAEKLMESHDEEMEWVGKMVERMLELGVTPKVQSIGEYAISCDPVAYLKEESEGSFASLDAFSKSLNYDELDFVTAKLIQEYYADEEADARWFKQQVDIIAAIGKENYLAKQI